jgi:hypothetical protein
MKTIPHSNYHYVKTVIYIFTIIKRCLQWPEEKFEATVVNRGGWGMGAEEFREAPMMHQKVPTLGRTNYTIDETRRNIYH